jgi:5-hydroxyisourate hydrolase
MSRISTHILNTSTGKPAAHVPVQLYLEDHEIASSQTDSDGRCANLVPEGHSITTATYKLVFDVGSIFAEGFYPHVIVAFKASEGTAHYHIPLLLSPYGYTTYRGS